jgi:hypothetical protein
MLVLLSLFLGQAHALEQVCVQGVDVPATHVEWGVVDDELGAVLWYLRQESRPCGVQVGEECVADWEKPAGYLEVIARDGSRRKLFAFSQSGAGRNYVEVAADRGGLVDLFRRVVRGSAVYANGRARSEVVKLGRFGAKQVDELTFRSGGWEYRISAWKLKPVGKARFGVKPDLSEACFEF